MTAGSGPGGASGASRAGLQARISRGAKAHYEDAAYYDMAYRRRRKDVHFYVDIARKLGGPVLELGVGTGRVALALASAGIDVLGIDASSAMLARATAKAAKLPKSAQNRLKLRRGDARKVRLEQRFPLVIAPFNVFMHFYTLRELAQALTTVKMHLTPRGRFVFDVLAPDLRAMVRRPGRLLKGPPVTHPETGRRYHYMEAYDYDTVRQVQMVSLIFQDMERLQDLKVVPLSQRQFFPQELEALLIHSGFAIEKRYGDFSGGPLEGDSESQVIVARSYGP